MEQIESSLAQALAEYGISDGTPVRRFGEGHINKTWLVESTPPLILQQINTAIFPDVEALVGNALAIERHLLAKQQRGHYPLVVLKQQPTAMGRYVAGPANDIRALQFIDGGRSIEVVETPAQAYAAAMTFGTFAAALADFDADALSTVIPHFHDLSRRFSQFEAAVAADRVGRAHTVTSRCEWVMQQQSLAVELQQVCAELPRRVCHNDTKINNMLYSDPEARGIAAIDLDTCMAGYWLFDFGDMVRTCCSPEPEDSSNVAEVRIRPEIFRALADGYLAGLRDALTTAERHSLWLGAKVMCLMIGLRFLTDYLDGDRYFHTKYAEHNLVRAENQFRLYQDLLAQEATLSAIFL